MPTDEKTAVKGQSVRLSGDKLQVGDKAPEVTLINGDLEDVVIGGAGNYTQLFVVVPSLDTEICAAETKYFNKRLSNLDIVETAVVSMDLPFASQRFCAVEGINNVTAVSDYLDKEFGEKYGVLMQEGPLRGLLARAIFVVNEQGYVTYKQIVDDVTSEPDYEKALEAVKDARL